MQTVRYIVIDGKRLVTSIDQPAIDPIETKSQAVEKLKDSEFVKRVSELHEQLIHLAQKRATPLGLYREIQSKYNAACAEYLHELKTEQELNPVYFPMRKNEIEVNPKKLVKIKRMLSKGKPVYLDERDNVDAD